MEGAVLEVPSIHPAFSEGSRFGKEAHAIAKFLFSSKVHFHMQPDLQKPNIITQDIKH